MEVPVLLCVEVIVDDKVDVFVLVGLVNVHSLIQVIRR